MLLQQLETNTFVVCFLSFLILFGQGLCLQNIVSKAFTQTQSQTEKKNGYRRMRACPKGVSLTTGFHFNYIFGPSLGGSWDFGFEKWLYLELLEISHLPMRNTKSDFGACILG